MRKRSNRKSTAWGTAWQWVRIAMCGFGMLGVLSSCESDFIDPFENESYFYSIYGYFDLLETEHVVRVVPVTRTPAEIRFLTDPQASIDAEVFSIDLKTGAEHEWEHQLHQLADGTYGHIFVGRYLPHPDHIYRLEVRRTDGTITAAEAVAPFFREEFPAQVSPLRVVEGRDVTRDVTIPELPTVIDYSVVYEFDNGIRRVRIPVNYAKYGGRTIDGAWEVAINVSRDQDIVRQELQRAPLAGDMALTKIALVMKIIDDSWNLPDGVSKEELAQPRTFTNVQNGYGFWGAIGVYAQEWAVDPELSAHLGYK